MARESIDPTICPVCKKYLGDLEASGVLDNGTLETTYICSEHTCGSEWTVVYRLIGMKDITDNREDNADVDDDFGGEGWDVDAWSVDEEESVEEAEEDVEESSGWTTEPEQNIWEELVNGKNPPKVTVAIG